MARRNGWQLAEAVGERSLDGVPRLVRTVRWEADTVRDDRRVYVVAHPGDPVAVLNLDEKGFRKKDTTRRRPVSCGAVRTAA